MTLPCLHTSRWFEARRYTVAAPDLPHHGDVEYIGTAVVAALLWYGSVRQVRRRVRDRQIRRDLLASLGPH